MDEKQYEELNALAGRLLQLSQNRLLAHFRFLSLALTKLKFLAQKNASLSTDAYWLIYNPVELLRLYKKDKQAPAHAYFHMVLHCIFNHMFIAPPMENPYWDLACDVIVESIICEQKLDMFENGSSASMRALIEELKHKGIPFKPDELCHYFMTNLDNATLSKMTELFSFDNHSCWRLPPQKRSPEQKSSESTNNNSDNTETNNPSDNANSNTKAPTNLSYNTGLRDEWKEVAELIRYELENTPFFKSNATADFMQALGNIKKENYDYSQFLKKFAVYNEEIKINEDEFDYVFYTYGLEHYDKMPLIEPLEYKDEKRIREFVIAIDTSGSVYGEQVQSFLQKTYNILKSAESFATKINIHIIQCDCEVKSDCKITSQKDFDAYINHLKLQGFGGTSFIPVFEYVEKLIQNKELNNLGGLIYFTDGFGDFPQKMPPYPTAFIFVDDTPTHHSVPSWALQLSLPKNELEDFTSSGKT